MRNHRLRRAFSIAALCIAAALCVQVGVIRVTGRDRDATRVRALEALYSARAEEVENLQAELDRSERLLETLRGELANAAREGSALEDALHEADAERGSLNARVAALSENLDGQRPSMDVTLAPTAERLALAASAENRGKQALTIRAAQGWLWVDGRPLALDGSLVPAELAPGGSADVFEFDPRSRSLEFVPDSHVAVQGALCFVYGRVPEGDSARWVEERWFEYRPGNGVAATIRSHSWPLADGALPCQLDDVEAPW